MYARILMALTGSALVVASLGAQRTPDLSGTWTVVPAESESDVPPVLGDEFTIAQDDEGLNLTLTRTMVRVQGTFRSGAPAGSRTTFSETPYSVTTPLKLDGSDSPGLTPLRRRTPNARAVSWTDTEQAVSRARWVGDTLVIVDYTETRHHQRSRTPAEWVGRAMLSLTLAPQPDGSLRVQRTRVTDLSPHATRLPRFAPTAETIYRRTSASRD